MIAQFQGAAGKPSLIKALQAQSIVCGEEPLATDLAALVELLQFEPEEFKNEIIQQDAENNEIYLILAGSVSIRIHNREVAKRSAGHHVGEMVLIDPHVPRSASVIATEQTVVARIAEPAFTSLAAKYPHLWRRLALELATRLRQRGSLVKPQNARPHIFIGSSAGGLPIAREIQAGLAADRMVVSVRSDNVFHVTHEALESLFKAVAKSDFALLVVTADDTTISRDGEGIASRDNSVFELGLFMGALGHDRSFLVKPRGEDLKLSADLPGLKLLEYAVNGKDTLTSRLAPLCDEIRTAVRTLGPK